MPNIKLTHKDELPFPYKCSRCGSASTCVDLGINLHDNAFGKRSGAVLICISCFDEVISIIGGYTKNSDIPVVDETSDNLMYQEKLRRARLVANDLITIIDDSDIVLPDSGIISDGEDMEGSQADSEGDSGLSGIFSGFGAFSDDTGGKHLESDSESKSKVNG